MRIPKPSGQWKLTHSVAIVKEKANLKYIEGKLEGTGS